MMGKYSCFMGGLLFGAGLIMALAGTTPGFAVLCLMLGSVGIAFGLHEAVKRRQ